VVPQADVRSAIAREPATTRTLCMSSSGRSRSGSPFVDV
jgi:hypothetical protein